jgi:hypothetical protein
LQVHICGRVASLVEQGLDVPLHIFTLGVLSH